MPVGRRPDGKRGYDSVTFRELDDDSNSSPTACCKWASQPGTRLVLMVPPSIDFISLVFALFKAGVVTVLIDPGMGRRNLIRCLAECEPEGFIGIPLAQAVRTSAALVAFPKAKFNVTVGRRWFWGGTTLPQLRAATSQPIFPARPHSADDPAAIIFTTGSTGPPKGVLYRHGNFDRQVERFAISTTFSPAKSICPAFRCSRCSTVAMGVTTVIPDMDPTRPARVDPRNIIEAVNDWNVTQAFGSPALWNVVGRYCEDNKIVLPTLKRVLSAGAPVPPHVLKRMKAAIRRRRRRPYTLWRDRSPAGGLDFGQRGASIRNPDRQIDCQCLGRLGPALRHLRRPPFSRHRLESHSHHRRADSDDRRQLKNCRDGEIGELIVRGPVVTTEYVTRTEANALHKIHDGETFWHRMGDVGYLQSSRHAPRDEPMLLMTACVSGSAAANPIASSRRSGTLFTIPCEADVQPASLGLSLGSRRCRRKRQAKPCRLHRTLARPLARGERTTGRAPQRNCSNSPSSTRTPPKFATFCCMPLAARRYPPQRQNFPRKAVALSPAASSADTLAAIFHAG